MVTRPPKDYESEIKVFGTIKPLKNGPRTRTSSKGPDPELIRRDMLPKTYHPAISPIKPFRIMSNWGNLNKYIYNPSDEPWKKEAKALDGRYPNGVCIDDFIYVTPKGEKNEKLQDNLLYGQLGEIDRVNYRRGQRLKTII